MIRAYEKARIAARAPATAIALMLSLAACSAYTPEALEPAPSPLPSRLLPLEIGAGESEVVRSEGVRGVTVQTDFATVFRRDLEANVFAPDTIRWGFAEFRVTYDNATVTPGGVALMVASIGTLFIGPMLGVPIDQHERTLQAEIVLYNARRVEVASYVIVGTARYYRSLYTTDEYRSAGINAAKNIMAEFKRRVSPESERINSVLRSVGPVS